MMCENVLDCYRENGDDCVQVLCEDLLGACAVRWCVPKHCCACLKRCSGLLLNHNRHDVLERLVESCQWLQTRIHNLWAPAVDLLLLICGVLENALHRFPKNVDDLVQTTCKIIACWNEIIASKTFSFAKFLRFAVQNWKIIPALERILGPRRAARLCYRTPTFWIATFLWLLRLWFRFCGLSTACVYDLRKNVTSMNGGLCQNSKHWITKWSNLK